MKFDNSYARLPERFSAAVLPTPVKAPRLIAFNRGLADELRLDVTGLDDERLAAIFSGNVVPQGAEPLAMAYAGHQFGGFVPQLGDGRAILLGEVIDRNGKRRDIQLKGSGPTPFSRRGDGRAALGPVLREYIVSEAMFALGIPATRALAAVLSGERVQREVGLPGGVFTRVAASHIRVGTFQFFAAREDNEAIRNLADYIIDRHYPEAKEAGNPYLALLQGIAQRQCDLIARWMMVGFIHGVMNTDNMAVSGETIDFGPCAFLDEYHPNKVFFPPSMRRAVTPITTSPASPSGTSQGWRNACCRCSIRRWKRPLNSPMGFSPISLPPFPNAGLPACAQNLA